MNKAVNTAPSPEKRIGTKVWRNEKLIAAANAMTVQIHDNGYAEVRNTWHSEKSALPFTRIYIVQKGTAWISDSVQTYQMEPNHVYIIPPGAACSYRCDGIMRKLYFHINVYNADHYDLLWGSQRIGCFPVERDYVETLLEHYRRDEYLDVTILRAELLRLFGRYLRQYRPAALVPREYSEVVLKTIDFINGHISAKLRIKELADRLFVSRTYLTERFRKETGVSLGKYIDDRLMQEAQLRLCRTEDSIYTISLDLGFSDQCYFSRRFKQLCGLTPQQYRSQNR